VILNGHGAIEGPDGAWPAQILADASVRRGSAVGLEARSMRVCFLDPTRRARIDVSIDAEFFR
jgi:hypothetical protein